MTGRARAVALVMAGAGLAGCAVSKCPEAEAPGSVPAAASPAAPVAAAPAEAPRARLVGPGGEIALPEFTTEERAKDVAVKTVRVAEGASYHVVRLARAEPPHAHDRSDLAVFVLSGSVNMHIGDRVVPVGPGDVVDVPKGVPHWAENASAAGPSFAFVVFAPAFDGKDRRPVGPAPGGAPAGPAPAVPPGAAAAPAAPLPLPKP